MFYLNYPDKVLLSEESHWWFIAGVNWMYKIGEPHDVLAKDLANARIRPGMAMWEWRDRRFRPICSGSIESWSLRSCMP
jgi:hypothetical protein